MLRNAVILCVVSRAKATRGSELGAALEPSAAARCGSGGCVPAPATGSPAPAPVLPGTPQPPGSWDAAMAAVWGECQQHRDARCPLRRLHARPPRQTPLWPPESSSRHAGDDGASVAQQLGTAQLRRASVCVRHSPTAAVKCRLLGASGLGSAAASPRPRRFPAEGCASPSAGKTRNDAGPGNVW